MTHSAAAPHSAAAEAFGDAFVFVRPMATGATMLEDGSVGHRWIVPSSSAPAVPDGWVAGWVSHHNAETGSVAEVVCWDPDRVRTVVVAQGPMAAAAAADLAATGWRRVARDGREVWVRPVEGRERAQAPQGRSRREGRSLAVSLAD